MSEGNIRKKTKIEEDYIDPPSIVDMNRAMLKEQRDCDVFFIVGQGKEKIGAHKAILKMRSSYFQVSLSGRWTNSSTAEENEIVLEDEEPSIFHSFLEHMYTYVFEASPFEAVELLHMAQYFGVPSLAKLCENVLADHSELDHLVQIFVLARKYGLTDVMNKAGQVMADYFPQLANSPSLDKFDEATLIYLMERDDLNVRETELVRILRRWADKQSENSAEDPKPERRDILKNLIPLIRFPTTGEFESFEVMEALRNIIPIEAESALLGEGNSSQYNTVPRKNEMVSVDLYAEKYSRSMSTRRNVSLKKCSPVTDIIRLTSLHTWVIPRRGKIVSLVLEPPNYSTSPFKNSSEVAAMKLPIRVAISCTETDTRTNQRTWISDEIFANLRSGQIVLQLDKPWVLSFEESKTYTIATRFLSDVYTVPDVVNDSGFGPVRDRNIDFFNSTEIRKGICIPFKRSSQMRVYVSAGVGSAASGFASQPKMLPSGLHLVRSVQFTEVYSLWKK